MHNNDKRNSIISFLIKAKRATYAGKGAVVYECYFTAIDNKVQEFCSEECNRSGEDSKNYVTDLSWVSLEDGQIEMGDWGRFVNVELRVSLDDQMNITDIYFQ